MAVGRSVHAPRPDLDGDDDEGDFGGEGDEGDHGGEGEEVGADEDDEGPEQRRFGRGRHGNMFERSTLSRHMVACRFFKTLHTAQRRHRRCSQGVGCERAQRADASRT